MSDDKKRRAKIARNKKRRGQYKKSILKIRKWKARDLYLKFRNKRVKRLHAKKKKAA